MVLFDHLQYSLPSLEQHGLNLSEATGKTYSKEAINKRFNDCSLEFIKKLFGVLLSQQLTHIELPSGLLRYFKSVKVMDSTEFKLPDSFAADFPGYSASNALACAAIQLEYDVISKRIHCLSIGSSRESDKTFADQKMDCIGENDLLLRDMGYYSVNSYLRIEQQKAFYISRLKQQICIYERNGNSYERLDWKGILPKIRKSTAGYFDQWVYIGEVQKHRVRLMAWSLTVQQQEERLRKRRSRKGKLREEDKIWSKLNIFITNIPDNVINARQAYNLYKIRWQIELVFKVWKSILNIDVVRKMKSNRLKCYLYSKLIWILICHDITAAVEYSSWKANYRLMSYYKCVAILKTRILELKQAIFVSQEKLKAWLVKIMEVLLKYGCKENKKGKVHLSNLFQLQYQIKG
jgi:hypothetical protein